MTRIYRMKYRMHSTHIMPASWCKQHPVSGMTNFLFQWQTGKKNKQLTCWYVTWCAVQQHRGELLLTFGGISMGPQKTSSVEDIGQNGDKGEMAISDIELLWGASRLERRLAFWENERFTHGYLCLETEQTHTSVSKKRTMCEKDIIQDNDSSNTFRGNSEHVWCDRTVHTWLRWALCMAGVQGLELLPEPSLDCTWLGKPAAKNSLARFDSWMSI